MTRYTERPWLRLYDPGCPPRIKPECESLTEVFARAVDRAPHRTLVAYHGTELSVRDVDELSCSLAVVLEDQDIRRGDRIAVALQNMPEYFVVALATWKLGAILVPINPMFRETELRKVLDDSGARVLVSLDSYHATVVAGLRDALGVEVYLTTSELDLASHRDAVELHQSRKLRPSDTLDLLEEIHAADRRPGSQPAIRSSDPAMLVYTSGTTGPAKGAIVTHRNAVFNAQAYRDWFGLSDEDTILGLAPLFHITGLIAHVALAMTLPATCLLTYRFDAGATIDLIERRRPTFTAASITAFIAMLHHDRDESRDLSSLTKILSGGAPIAPSVAEAWEARFGTYITNIYGLTESTSPSHMVPAGRRAPVDPESGALSVGVPIFNTTVRVLDDAGHEQPVGQPGELATSGPQVVPGYWHNAEESANAIVDGELRTGDIGFMNASGWFFVVDRKKDQINASGFKVWPREVEDVLYQHAAVREAAVVGVPDPYRGENVKAYVSLATGSQVEPDDLIAFCRARLSTYKCPRLVEIVDDLPKTASGKILRRELRARDIT